MIVAEHILLLAFALLCFCIAERERSPVPGAKEVAYRLFSASMYALGMICVQEASGIASVKYNSLSELITSWVLFTFTSFVVKSILDRKEG